MFLNIRLLMETRHGVTLLPVQTIQYHQQGAFVYLVKPNRTVTIRPVVMGIIEAAMLAIKDGLSPGETVVLDVPDGLHEGSRVR